MNRINPSVILLGSAVILSLTFSCRDLHKIDHLKEGFVNPPDSCKPGVYWYFMDGNIDRKAITDDLESMKEAGIGYVLFLEVNVGIPRGKVDFLSEKWQDLFTHAVRECERLGIRLILGSGPGWAGSGGPWVKPEQSMMHLAAFDTILTGPIRFSGKIAVPDPWRPFFGEESLTPALKKIRDTWYEDVRVLAFQTPYNDRKLSDIDEKALYYRAPFTSQPGVRPFIKAPETFEEIPGAAISKEKIIDITMMLDSDGTLQWSVPPGRWTVIRFAKRNNGAVTRPAPLPGLGFEADKFDTTSFKAHWDAYIGKLVERVKPDKSNTNGGWKMIHIDSWEMGAQNWSHRFIEEFIRRRGYDPLLYLPVYSGYVVNSVEQSERFLWDVRQTANELVLENHAGYFKMLGRRNGFRLSIEPYDMNPAADLSLGEIADVPMCEFWTEGLGFNSSFSCLEAASVAHVTGKPVVAAEAFTADHREAWKMYPGNMKNQTDWAFATGINRIIFHTFTHKSTGDTLLPGITMGPYGVHWDRGQTWWPMVSEYHKYISRCQFLLSQGRPVRDILYLTPEGAPNVFRPPFDATEGSDFLPDMRGYSFDACTPKYFINNATVSDRKIFFPSGISYKLLVIPDVAEMSVELLNKIESLLKLGAVAAGYPPLRAPSLTNFPGSDSTVRRIAEMIWKTGMPDTESSRIKWGFGTVYRPVKRSVARDKNIYELYPSWKITEEEILKYSNIREDFISEGHIRYIHRATGDREIYFISNRTPETVDDSCYFRDGTKYAETWDPVTAEISRIKNTVNSYKGTGIKIRLEPYESRFVVFYHNPDDRHITTFTAGDSGVAYTVMEYTGRWTVEFNPSLGGPDKVTFHDLGDWTENKDSTIRYYSGIAKYTCTFDLPDSVSANDTRDLFIDLGTVNDIARVTLNGKGLGILWTAPMCLKAGGQLKQKGNKLEIEVSNRWINRLIGDEELPWDGIENGKWPDWIAGNTPRTSGRITFTTNRFYKKNDTLVSSGLKGPVRLVRLK